MVLTRPNKVLLSDGTIIELAAGLQSNLAKLGQAVEKEDHVQIGAIIRDSIIPNFAALEIEIGKTLDTEGIQKNLN